MYIGSLFLFLQGAELPNIPNYEDVGLKSALFVMVFLLGWFAYKQVQKKDAMLQEHAKDKDEMQETFRKEILDIQEKTLVVLNLQEKSSENIIRANEDVLKAIEDLKKALTDTIKNHRKDAN